MLVTDLKPAEYDQYTHYYLQKVPAIPLHDVLQKSKRDVLAFFDSIPEQKHTFRYEEGKWTIKDILQHMVDVDRIFSYRALRFGRGDTVALPGFEVDDYSGPARANERDMASLLEEFETVRTGTQLLFNSLPPESLTHIGTASGSSISVRAIGFKLVGHDTHHCEVIKNRYL